MTGLVLQPLENSDHDALSAGARAKPVQLNAVVTKGNIRVVSKTGLQIVSTGSPEPDAESVKTDSVAANSLRDSETIEDGGAAVDVEPAQPVAAQPWNSGFCDPSNEQQTIDSELLNPPGPPMKLIKLIAAAGVLAVAAIALTFLQFSGPDGAAGDQKATVTQVFSPVIASADASPLLAAEVVSGADGADMVAQITAGTLAALREGPASVASAAPVTVAGQVAVQPGETNGLYAMVLNALQQGQSRQYIDQMVNEAHRAQRVTVPTVLLTSSGDVNTSALLTLFGGQ